MKTIAAILAIALIIPTFNSCIFDAKEAKKEGPPPPPPFRDLTQHDDVLFNLALAYNQSNLDEYGKLLDDNFIFNFSAADVNNGTVTVSQWDRVSELAATANIFNQGTLPPGRDPVSNIKLELYFNDGADDWQPVTPPDPQAYPGEEWFYQRIDYHLTVVAGDITYTQNVPLKAEFTIRPVDDNGTTIWRVISWRDLGEV